MPYGCGQCFPCTLNRRHIWSNRILLESFKHPKNAFITLTYKKETEPSDRSLKHSDFQKFLKKLRKASGTTQLRYYMCGEYGEENQRPHYHAIIFGLGPEDALLIDKSWGKGWTFTGDVTHDSAQYVAGYCTKKMNHPESKCTPKCKHPPLNGRFPEYSRMSLKPGIGATAVSDIADTLTSPAACDALSEIGDVPHALRLGKKSMPLGKYIRGKLREKVGFGDTKTPQIALDRWKAEMQKLHEDYVATTTETPLTKYVDSRQHFKQYIIEKNAQKVLQLETKSKIFSAKKDKV